MHQYVTCTKCNGSGRVRRTRWFGTKDCPSCDGIGKVPKAVTKATSVRRTEERAVTHSAPANDDGDIIAGVALMVAALDRGNTIAVAQPEEAFKGGGGEMGGGGASDSWDKPEERAAEPEPVAEVVTTFESSEPASESAASDSSSSSDSGSSDT
ncbi:MAG: hypothetical protein WCT41_01210 [Candidatus Paceibacterota bacterium]|jgi:hypothetical protein